MDIVTVMREPSRSQTTKSYAENGKYRVKVMTGWQMRFRTPDNRTIEFWPGWRSAPIKTKTALREIWKDKPTHWSFEYSNYQDLQDQVKQELEKLFEGDESWKKQLLKVP